MPNRDVSVEVAHELRSLADGAARCVRLAAGHLEGHTESTEAVRTRLGAAEEAIGRITDVLERVMHSGDLSTETIDPTTPLAAATSRILSDLSPLAEAHRIDMQLEIDDAAGVVPIGRLSTVIQNGLRNAIEASGRSTIEHRRVDLSVQCRGGRLNILIVDCGPGVPPSWQRGGTTKEGGHGIGLELCRKIVDQLGGRMRLCNVPFGPGAVFDVDIPLRKTKAA